MHLEVNKKPSVKAELTTYSHVLSVPGCLSLAFMLSSKLDVPVWEIFAYSATYNHLVPMPGCGNAISDVLNIIQLTT